MNGLVQNSPSDFEHELSPIAELVDQRMAMILREKTPAERLKIAFGLWRFTRSTLLRRLAADHSDWTFEQVCQEAARRMMHDT